MCARPRRGATSSVCPASPAISVAASSLMTRRPPRSVVCQSHRRRQAPHTALPNPPQGHADRRSTPPLWCRTRARNTVCHGGRFQTKVTAIPHRGRSTSTPAVRPASVRHRYDPEVHPNELPASPGCKSDRLPLSPSRRLQSCRRQARGGHDKSGSSLRLTRPPPGPLPARVEAGRTSGSIRRSRLSAIAAIGCRVPSVAPPTLSAHPPPPSPEPPSARTPRTPRTAGGHRRTCRSPRR